MDLELADRTVLITGGTDGLGLATAHDLRVRAACGEPWAGKAVSIDPERCGDEEKKRRQGRTTSGERPRPRRSRTLACVGLVFCSPTLPTTGTSETCSCRGRPHTHEPHAPRERAWARWRWPPRGQAGRYQAKVVVADSELELAHGLHERRTLNVADSAAELGLQGHERAC